MQPVTLNIVELLDIVRVCGTLQLDKCPAYFLRDYIAGGLAASDPDLAAKVRRLDEDQLERLCVHVKDVQRARRAQPAPLQEMVSA
ncbi:MAG TPA: hypothetical protein VKE94_18280 [Gemmataceae bacterium]|nr:hypothetical protein [Gemmataceae bacterium]